MFWCSPECDDESTIVLSSFIWAHVLFVLILEDGADLFSGITWINREVLHIKYEQSQSNV